MLYIRIHLYVINGLKKNNNANNMLTNNNTLLIFECLIFPLKIKTIEISTKHLKVVSINIPVYLLTPIIAAISNPPIYPEKNNLGPIDCKSLNTKRVDKVVVITKKKFKFFII